MNTDPKHRQRGYIRKLLTRGARAWPRGRRLRVGALKACTRSRLRQLLTEWAFCAVVFVDPGCAHTPCRGAACGHLRPRSAPLRAALFNEVHVQRRRMCAQAGTNRKLADMGAVGSAVILLADGAALAYYAIVTERRFGVVHSPYIVDELAALLRRSWQVALLAEAATICADQGATEGCASRWTAQQAVSHAAWAASTGCASSATGGMMGGIFHRSAPLGAPGIAPQVGRGCAYCGPRRGLRAPRARRTDPGRSDAAAADARLLVDRRRRDYRCDRLGRPGGALCGRVGGMVPRRGRAILAASLRASTGPILGRNRRIYRVGTLVGKRSAARRLAYAPAFIRIFARHLFVFLRVV